MSKRENTIFSPIIVLSLAAAGVIAMLGVLFTTTFGDGSETRVTVGANSFSLSAIGHKAVVDTIREMEIPVMVSRYRTQDRLDHDNSVLLLLEPSVSEENSDILSTLIDQPNVILVLPKRRGAMRDLTNIRWLAHTSLVGKERANRYIRLVDENAEIVQLAKALKKNTEADGEKEDNNDAESDTVTEEERAAEDVNNMFVDLTNTDDGAPQPPQNWIINKTTYEPEIRDIQLIKSDFLEPIISSENGILVGSAYYAGIGTTLVISDPDLISNAGLGKGDNANIFFYALNSLISNNSTVFVDETIHGFDRNPNLLRSAMEYPFNYISLLVVIFIVLLVWSAMQRFGSPPKILPEYKTGKLVLIKNGVNLLNHGNHKPEILARYVELMQHAMARRLHAPKNLNDDEMVEWLDNYGSKHGVSLSLKTIKHRSHMARGSGKAYTNTFMDHIHEKPLIQIAKYMEQWKQEMLDGSGSDKVNQ